MSRPLLTAARLGPPLSVDQLLLRAAEAEDQGLDDLARGYLRRALEAEVRP